MRVVHRRRMLYQIGPAMIGPATGRARTEVPRRRRLRAIAALACAMLVGSGLVLLAALAAVRARRLPEALRCPDGWVADAALVPSGDAQNLRTLEAVRLYGGGQVKMLLFSGQGFGGDRAENLAALARAHGVPGERIAVEPGARNTWENMTLSRPILARAGAARVIVVTSAVHGRRAGLDARAALPGLEVKVDTVEDGAGPLAGGRELLKLIRDAAVGRLDWRSILGRTADTARRPRFALDDPRPVRGGTHSWS